MQQIDASRLDLVFVLCCFLFVLKHIDRFVPHPGLRPVFFPLCVSASIPFNFIFYNVILSCLFLVFSPNLCIFRLVSFCYAIIILAQREKSIFYVYF